MCSSLTSKFKLICQHRFSRANVIAKLSCYTTRVLVVVVWCSVLWSFLTKDALPRQYINYLMNRNSRSCIVSSMDIPIQDIDRLSELLPDDWNDTMLTSHQFSVLTVSDENNSTSYQVLLVRQNAECQNILELEGFTAVLNDDFNDTTQTPGAARVDLLDRLYPNADTNLLDIPDGHFFALILLLILSSIFGVLAKWVFLPPLFGMIIAGFLLRNLPSLDFARHISTDWSSTIRNVALVIVLTRGGLSMDIKQLKRLKIAVLLLAFLPCVFEGIIDGLVGTFLLGFPWQWAFTLGYIIAAISPAVVVPTTLQLQNNGYGVESGIPTLIIAAASMDVVISISLFGVFLGLAFSEGNLVLDIFRAPIQIIVGLLYGIIFGFLLWVFPTKHFKKVSKVRNRFFLIFGLGLFSLFGSSRAVIGGSSLAGSGALGVLILAFVAGQGWEKGEKALVSRVFLLVWQLAEPLLFGLIGAEVDLQFITPSLVGQGIALILIGLVLRVITSYVVVFGNGFSLKEMGFVAIAWIPKATVQAAIGSIALDLARERNDSEEAEEIQLGQQVLTIAVLAIVLTAPLGALATSLLGPVLLKKKTTTDLEEQEPKPEERIDEVKESSPSPDLATPQELNKEVSSGYSSEMVQLSSDRSTNERSVLSTSGDTSSNNEPVDIIVIKEKQTAECLTSLDSTKKHS